MSRGWGASTRGAGEPARWLRQGGAPDRTAVSQTRADHPGADSAWVTQHPWPLSACMRRPGCLLALSHSAMLLARLSGCPGWHARHWPVHLVMSAGRHPIK